MAEPVYPSTWPPVTPAVLNVTDIIPARNKGFSAIVEIISGPIETEGGVSLTTEAGVVITTEGA